MNDAEKTGLDLLQKIIFDQAVLIEKQAEMIVQLTASGSELTRRLHKWVLEVEARMAKLEAKLVQ